MGAPGLAFETRDPPPKCRKTKLENVNFEKAPVLMPLDRILTDTLRPRWNVRENSGPPAFAWRIPGLKSETWGTHRLFQEVLRQTLKPYPSKTAKKVQRTGFKDGRNQTQHLPRRTPPSAYKQAHLALELSCAARRRLDRRGIPACAHRSVPRPFSCGAETCRQH